MPVRTWRGCGRYACCTHHTRPPTVPAPHQQTRSVGVSFKEAGAIGSICSSKTSPQPRLHPLLTSHSAHTCTQSINKYRAGSRFSGRARGTQVLTDAPAAKPLRLRQPNHRAYASQMLSRSCLPSGFVWFYHTPRITLARSLVLL